MISNANTIKEAARIEEIVGEFVDLKKKGAALMACCPFHGERTPSFSVSPSKQMFKCFGCDKSGDATKFLMEHLNLTYPESLEHIAKKYGIAIEYDHTDDPKFEEKEVIRAAMPMIQGFFKSRATPGIEYFAGRGLTPDTIETFGVGWCNSAEVPMLPNDTIKKAGLSNEKGNLYFYHRATLPIRNEKGAIVSFAGRTLEADGAPKYINGAESPIFSKSKVLYGLWENMELIRKHKLAIIVEGYTDVMMLHQHGCIQAVASCGTSLTDDQCKLLSRYTPNAVILYDGDAAGQKAALRAAMTAYPHFDNLRVVLLENGEDPDSFVREKGLTALYNRVYNNYTEAGVFYCTTGALWSTQDGKRIISTRLRELLKRVEDVRRPALVDTLAGALGISSAALMRYVFPVLSEAHATAYASFQAQFLNFEMLLERRARWCLAQQQIDTAAMSKDQLAAHTSKLERVEGEISIMADLRTAIWAIEEIYLSHLPKKK